MLSWPAQSLDLNPIENPRDEIKQSLKNAGGKKILLSLNDLWKKLGGRFLKKKLRLIESIPQVQAVIEANDSPNKY